MNIRYRVTLTEQERAQLTTLVQGGKAAVRRIKRAQILWPQMLEGPTRGLRRTSRSVRRRSIAPSGASSKKAWSRR